MTEERMTVAEARELLGVSNKKMTDMLKKGELSYTVDPLDKRVKLVKRSDVEALRAGSAKSAAAA